MTKPELIQEINIQEAHNQPPEQRAARCEQLWNASSAQAEKAPHADSINKPFKPLQGPSLHVAVSSTSLVRDMPASKTPDAAITEAPVVEHRGSPPCDPQSVREYAPDIIQQFFTKKTKALALADYMDRQPDITAKMRMILMDWMIEVHLKYRLRPETLHLTVNLVD